MTIFRTLAIACAVSILALSSAQSQDKPATSTYTPQSGQAGKDVVWVPTPQALVDRMMELAKVTKDDYLIDLGSGDGRTVITAAKLGIRALGVEYNPDMVVLAQKNAQEAGVSNLATFVRGDIFEYDFTKATVVTLFLLPTLNLRLRPTLLDMKPGTRVVSNSFDMGEWEPDDRVEAGGDCKSYCRAMKWVIPAKVGGTWKLGNGQLQLTQTFQMLAGTLTLDGKAEPISAAKMDGESIAFTAGGKRYIGRVAGSAMSGTIEGGGAWSATRAN
jgi:hypothetical protein